MNQSPEDLRLTLDDLKQCCNTSLLHVYDKERIITAVWRFAERGILGEQDLVEIARDEQHWGDHGVEFLRETIHVVEAMYPMVKRIEFRPI